MAKFNYDIEIKAPSENEADFKMEAVKILIAKLTTNELNKLAQVVKSDPITFAIAKQALGV